MPFSDGELPHYRGQQPERPVQQRVVQTPPNVQLDEPGEAYLQRGDIWSCVWDWSQPDRLAPVHVVIRFPDRKDVAGRIVLPKPDGTGLVALKFRLATRRLTKRNWPTTRQSPLIRNPSGWARAPPWVSTNCCRHSFCDTRNSSILGKPLKRILGATCQSSTNGSDASPIAIPSKSIAGSGTPNWSAPVEAATSGTNNGARWNHPSSATPANPSRR